MKFTSEVIAALAVLRSATENDFERHRLDVLERDLITPPVVEVIDDKHQFFNGETYYVDKDGHYRKLVYLHRAVWVYCVGDIPKGDYEIHHKNRKANDNSPSNLQLLTKCAHRKIHRKREGEIVCPVCGKIFANNSHCSKYCSRICAGKARRK